MHLKSKLNKQLFRLDRSMTEEYALKISKFILKDKDSISVNSFTELFEINENGGFFSYYSRL